MAESKKISELDSVFSLTSADEFIVIDKSTITGDDAAVSGKTSKITFDKVKEGLFPAGIPEGEKGIQGSKGEPGQSITGAKGEVGVSTKGEKGSVGDSIKGSAGVAGPVGPPGPIGTSVKGEPGQSITGTKGSRGDSVTGQPGSSGVRMEISNGVLTFITQ